MRRTLASSLVALTVSLGAIAVAAPAAPLRGRIVGSWEAIGEDDFRVFKMEIASRDSDSMIAMTAGRVDSVTYLFKVTRLDVRGRRFELDAKGTDGPDGLRIRGTIRRLGFMSSEGLIDATVKLVGPDSRTINSWRVAFLNYGGEYLRRIGQLSADAAAKIQEAKKAGAPGVPSQ